jgi:Bacterial Ig domain/Immunoglobulin domain
VCAVSAVILSCSAILLSGCAGLVSSANSTGNPPPPSALVISNVQTVSATTSTSQVIWTTNVAADSSVDYGTTTAYGNSTPIDSAMVTSHQVTLSGLAAGTIYYYQVNSTDAKGNHGHSSNKFSTGGFSLSGTITPATGGSGATLALSGTANATTTTDSAGNYTFVGLANGTYSIVPSHAGFTITPSSQSVSVNGANIIGVNFTDTAQTFSISGTISPTAGSSGATVMLSGAASATTTANSLGAYTFTGVASGSYAITPSNTGYTFTPVSQSVTVSTVNVTGVNFTDSAAAVAPTITTQPTNQTVTAGQTATFAVVAGGTAPLSYQWQKNGANIAGATAASYTTPVTATADSGSMFRVVVSNTAGTVTSAAATLTVTVAPVAPTIATQPGNQTVTAGQKATFAVVATGTAPLSYQWQKNSANISGATLASYTTSATTTTDNGSTFQVVVSNSAGSVTSRAATLTVNPAVVAPTITTQPTNQTVTAGQTASFSVVASGTAPLSYQWQKNGANISGATFASYITPATTSADNGSTFQVVVSNSAGSMTSSAASLTVNPDTIPPIVAITSPVSGATVSGTITVTASASDNVAVASVQLQVDGANVGAADTASPYSFSLDTLTLSNGSHNLTAFAIDTSGNQATSAAVGITISNQSNGATAAYANNGAGCPINTVPGGPTDLVTSYTCPLPNPTGAGNLLVMWVRYSDANSPTLSFTTNLGTLTATQAVSCLDNANNQTESRLYYVANVPAGINVVTVNFSTSSSYVQLQPYEFYNVATTSALDQAVCQVSSGTSISSGALPDLSVSGDLVVQFGFADNGVGISSCAIGSQSNITWTMRAALIASSEPMCFQYGNYNSTASFSPNMTFGTSVSYVSLSAAFRAANAGTPPGSGIRVVYIQHDDGYSQGANALKFQLPISGNLAVELTSAGCSSNTLSSCPYPTGFSDGTNTWNLISGAQYLSSTGSSQETVGSNWYASNVAPGYYTLNVTQHGCTGGCAPFPDSYIMFDIAGASANPLDLGFGGAGNGLASISNISATSAPITTFTAAPSGPNELILAQAGYEWDTFTGLTSPNGAQFVSAYYTAETNYSWCDLNGGWGLLYNGSSTAPVTWTWAHDSSQFPGAGRGLALGVAFK